LTKKSKGPGFQQFRTKTRSPLSPLPGAGMILSQDSGTLGPPSCKFVAPRLAEPATDRAALEWARACGEMSNLVSPCSGSPAAVIATGMDRSRIPSSSYLEKDDGSGRNRLLGAIRRGQPDLPQTRWRVGAIPRQGRGGLPVRGPRGRAVSGRVRRTDVGNSADIGRGLRSPEKTGPTLLSD